MNADFLGDAKDMAKGFMLDWLRRQQLIAGPFVLPLYRETPEVAAMQTYSSMLGVAPETVFTRVLWSGVAAQRCDYLEAASTHRLYDTVFVDPDTGVRRRVHGTSCSPKYRFVSFSNLRFLLRGDDIRLLIVYDESYRNAERAHIAIAVRSKLKTLVRSASPSIDAFGYVGIAVNLLFVANKRGKQKLQRIEASLSRLLNGSPTKRIVRP